MKEAYCHTVWHISTSRCFEYSLVVYDPEPYLSIMYRVPLLLIANVPVP